MILTGLPNVTRSRQWPSTHVKWIRLDNTTINCNKCEFVFRAAKQALIQLLSNSRVKLDSLTAHQLNPIALPMITDK